MKKLSALFLFAFILRLFLLGTEFWRSPDSVEYINVAQNIISGKGLTQTIKWHFFDNAPVVTSALKGRPLITPLIFTGLLSFINNLYVIQAFLLFLGAVNVILFYFLARKFFSVNTSFLAGLLAACNPNLLITNRLILSEPIFTFFVLGFFLIFFTEKKKIWMFILLGILPALAYLTRFEGFFLLLLLPLMKERKIKYLLISILAFIIYTLPYFVTNFLINHSPFYSYNTYHFRVHNFSEGMWNGFGKVFPRSEEFVRNNFTWIIKTNTLLLFFDLKTIFGFGFLSFLSFGYLLIIKQLQKKYIPLVLFSVFSIMLLSIIWSGFAEPERHFSTIYFLLLIPIFSLFQTYWRKLMIILFIITMIIYGILDIHRISWARVIEPTLDNHGLENKTEAYAWIKTHTESNAIIAGDNPWMIYLNTKHPSIIFSPQLETNGLLEKYLKTYNVSYIVTDHKLNKKYLFNNNGVTIYCGLTCN